MNWRSRTGYNSEIDGDSRAAEPAGEQVRGGAYERIYGCEIDRLNDMKMIGR